MEHGSADKNTTSYTAVASPQPHEIALLDRPAPPSPFLKTRSPCFCLSPLSRHFVYPCLSPLVLKMTLEAPLLQPPLLPPCCLWPPLLSSMFTGGPIMKGAQQTQRKPQSGPGDPRLTPHNPSCSRISHSEQSGSHGSVYVLQPYPSPLPAFSLNPSVASLRRSCPTSALMVHLHGNVDANS